MPPLGSRRLFQKTENEEDERNVEHCDPYQTNGGRTSTAIPHDAVAYS